MTLDISGPIEKLFASFIAALPTILIFIVIVVGGILLAPMAARVVSELVRRSGLETLLERLGAPRLLYRIGYKSGTARLLGSLARWGVYLIAALIAADVAGMKQIANGLDVVIGYLPRVGVAVLFLMVGMWAADLVRSVVSGVSKDKTNVIGTILYYGIVAITVALVADQLGLETSLINNIILLVIAAACAAAAIGAGLSAKPTLSNLLARNYVAQLYARGDRVVIDGVEGVVKSHSPTALVLVGKQGTFNVPYVRFMEEVTETSGEARPLEQPDENGADESADADG